MSCNGQIFDLLKVKSKIISADHLPICFKLDKYSIEITSLAQGVPVGGELDYLDDSTIVAAFNARRKFD